MSLHNATKDELEKAVLESSSFRQVILKFRKTMDSRLYAVLRIKLNQLGINTPHFQTAPSKTLDELKSTRESRRAVLKQYYAERRQDPKLLPDIILKDCRMHDKERYHQNDLTRAFIAHAIADGCRYCGDTTTRMTLDRIDNSKGHIQINVVPCCLRCNFIRRDMPYEAWITIVNAIRKTRELGLFGKWVGGWRPKHLRG